MYRHALLAAFEAEALGGGCLDRYPIYIQAHYRSECGAHSVDMGAQFGALHCDGAIYV